jgi:beta-phosphoglucomutase-like phosphatase (HAD superfamily)
MLGSVLEFDAYIVDLDGVVTNTAVLHARAWKALFDDFVARNGAGGEVAPFRISEDYALHLRGRSHAEGVRRYLQSRNIELPEGSPADDENAATVHALAKRKSEIFGRLIADHGVHVFTGSLRFLDRLHAATRPTALVTASRNGGLVLERAGIAERFDVVVDGRVFERERLEPQPSPAGFLFAAAWLGVEPAWTVVIEATETGVMAAREGGFGCVVGVRRGSSRAGLKAAGADLVVEDLAELL